MKISIPDDLRQRITDCLEQLDADLKSDATQRGNLAEKIAKFEAEQDRLTSEIATLKGQILADASAADKIPARQLHLEALAAALVELRGKLSAMEPVGLWAAKAVLKDVIQHWHITFPETFADYVSHSFVTRQSAINVAKLSDARRVLTPLTTRCENLRDATAANVEFLQGVFNRALAGRPHLGLDVSEPKAMA